MTTFGPMAAAIDWLDAYRAVTLSIVDLYALDASLHCGCDGDTTVVGRSALLNTGGNASMRSLLARLKLYSPMAIGSW